MILTVTLNAALDVTYEVDAVAWDEVNRVQRVHRRAGGKGVNVARVLARLGHEVVVTGFAGGPTGTAIHTDLATSRQVADPTSGQTTDVAAGRVTDALVAIAGNSRTTLVVTTPPPFRRVDETVYGGARRNERGPQPQTTLFNEPGPEVTREELDAFLSHYTELARQAEAVVISGSLPRGVPEHFYGTLADLAGKSGVPVIVDAEGETLLKSLDGRPSIVKPNAKELADSLPDVGGDDRRRAEVLRRAGAESVVVSQGAEGLLAVTPEGVFRARLPYRVEGNATGAGDALVAGLALGLAEGTAWQERLRVAAALGAAAVAAPVAGEFDEAVFAEISAKILIEGAH